MNHVQTIPSGPAPPPAPPVPVPSTELAEDLRRLQTEAQAMIERQRQEELARLRELARFD